MHWSELTDHIQGIMIFESLENARTAIPMTDAAGSRQFRQSQKDQLDFIWNTMLPRSEEYDKEMAEKRKAFKSRRPMYKALEDKINKERGTYKGK